MGNAESTQSADDTQMQVQQATDDEPWWNNIEHENLVLEQAPQAPTTAAKRTEEEEPPNNRKENRKTLVAVQMEEKANDSPEKEQSLEEFREELRQKREVRQNAVQDMRDEIASLKKQLAKEQAENRRLRKEEGAEDHTQIQDASLDTPSRPDSDPDDENPSSRSRHANIELASAQLALQQAQAENLSLRGEVEVVQRQVGTLKEVISCCKQMLSVKEEQCAQVS